MSLSDKFSIIIPPQDIECNPNCIQRLANGDRLAFEWVYKNYSKKIHDYAFLLTGNETESDDIVQDIFLRLWLARENLKEVQNFNAYLNTMAKNFIVTFFDTKAKQKAHLQKYNYTNDKFVNQKEAAAEFWSEEIHLIKKAVEQLPPQRKIVYKMRRVEGMTRMEIAGQLNISKFTVQNHMQKSLRFVKEYVVSNLEE